MRPEAPSKELERASGATAALVRELQEAYEEAGGELDFNNSKDFYGRLNYLTWLRGALSIRTFAYRGTSGFLQDVDDPDSFVPGGNSFNRWGFDLRWDQENGYVSTFASVQFFDDNLDRTLLSNPSAVVTTGEVQAYIVPWFVSGFHLERRIGSPIATFGKVLADCVPFRLLTGLGR